VGQEHERTVLTFHSDSSELCEFPPVIFARRPPQPSSPGSAGTPPAGRGELAQPWDVPGSPPGSSSNAISRCEVFGLQLAAQLLASAGHRTRAGSEVAGRRGWLGQRVDGMAPAPSVGRCGVCGSGQLPAGPARAAPTASPLTHTAAGRTGPPAKRAAQFLARNGLKAIPERCIAFGKPCVRGQLRLGTGRWAVEAQRRTGRRSRLGSAFGSAEPELPSARTEQRCPSMQVIVA